MSLLLLIVFLFSTSVKMSIEADMLVDMVLETHPTSPHVDNTAFKSQPVRPSAPEPNNIETALSRKTSYE